jgi:hypothetical protein
MFAVQDSQGGIILPYRYHDQIFPGMTLTMNIVRGLDGALTPAEYLGRNLVTVTIQT